MEALADSGGVSAVRRHAPGGRVQRARHRLERQSDRRPDPRTDQPSARRRWTSAAGEFAGSRRLLPCMLTVTDVRLNPSP